MGICRAVSLENPCGIHFPRARKIYGSAYFILNCGRGKLPMCFAGSLRNRAQNVEQSLPLADFFLYFNLRSRAFVAVVS